jgi:hypothetical protein
MFYAIGALCVVVIGVILGPALPFVLLVGALIASVWLLVLWWRRGKTRRAERRHAREEFKAYVAAECADNPTLRSHLGMGPRGYTLARFALWIVVAKLAITVALVLALRISAQISAPGEIDDWIAPHADSSTRRSP